MITKQIHIKPEIKYFQNFVINLHLFTPVVCLAIFLRSGLPYILSFLWLYYGRFMAILRPFSDHLIFCHFLALSWPFSDHHLAIFYLFYVVQDHLIVRSSFRLLIVHPTAQTIVVHLGLSNFFFIFFLAQTIHFPPCLF